MLSFNRSTTLSWTKDQRERGADLGSAVQRFELLRKTAESSGHSRSRISRRVNAQQADTNEDVIEKLCARVAELEQKAQQTPTQKQQAGDDRSKRKNHRQQTAVKEAKKAESCEEASVTEELLKRIRELEAAQAASPGKVADMSIQNEALNREVDRIRHQGGPGQLNVAAKPFKSSLVPLQGTVQQDQPCQQGVRRLCWGCGQPGHVSKGRPAVRNILWACGQLGHSLFTPMSTTSPGPTDS